jgi:formimidoylglutamate deiminase
LPEGWKRDVRVDVAPDGTIAAVETDSVRADATLLAGPVIAGMPNAHSHVLQRALAGRAEGAGGAGDSFWSWRETMYAFAQAIDPDEFEAIATSAFVEMLKAGYTSVAEFHYLHRAPGGVPYARPGEMSERVLSAARSAGIAVTLLPVLYRYSGFGSQAPDASQARFVMKLEEFTALWDALAAATRGTNDVRLGVAAHSLRAVTCAEIAALLAQVDALAAPGNSASPGARLAVPVHIHISEQRREVEACVAHFGTTPVELLARELELGPRWSLVHATHATPGELARVARSQAVVVVCPTTEANLGDGIFSGAAFVAEGGRIAIGSDSHVSLDVAEELRWLEYAQRLALQRRHVLGNSGGGDDAGLQFDVPALPLGERLYCDASRAGAQSLGRPVGAIAPGCRADLLVLRWPGDDAPSLDRAIFRSGAWTVRDVFVGGRAVIRDGVHPAEERIERDATEALRAVLQRT